MHRYLFRIVQQYFNTSLKIFPRPRRKGLERGCEANLGNAIIVPRPHLAVCAAISPGASQTVTPQMSVFMEVNVLCGPKNADSANIFLQGVEMLKFLQFMIIFDLCRCSKFLRPCGFKGK